MLIKNFPRVNHNLKAFIIETKKKKKKVNQSPRNIETARFEPTGCCTTYKKQKLQELLPVT